jgi:hypothetical protein
VADQRSHERLLRRRQRGEEADHEEGHRDAVHVGAQTDYQLPHRLLVQETVAEQYPDGLEQQGRRHCDQVDADVIEGGRPGSPLREDEHGRHAVPGIPERGDPAIPAQLAAKELWEDGEDVGEGGEQRHEVQRGEEQQRDEDQLLRRRVEVPVLEGDARHDRHTEDEADRQHDVHVPLVGHEQRDCDRGSEEQERGDAVDHALA